MNHINRENKGFSLISVMASMVIIAILLGLTSHMIYVSRATAQRIQCTSNLKQIYQYLLMYLEDQKDLVPKLLDFDQSISGFTQETYLKNVLEKYLLDKTGQRHDLTAIFSCPSDRVHGSFEKQVRGSYDYRDELSRGYSHFTFSGIKNPQNKIIMGDFRAGWHDHPYQNEIKINVLFADGHVEWMTENEWQTGLDQPLV